MEVPECMHWGRVNKRPTKCEHCGRRGIYLSQGPRFIFARCGHCQMEWQIYPFSKKAPGFDGKASRKETVIGVRSVKEAHLAKRLRMRLWIPMKESGEVRCACGCPYMLLVQYQPIGELKVRHEVRCARCSSTVPGLSIQSKKGRAKN